MTMQRYDCSGTMCPVENADSNTAQWVRFDEIAAHVDELNAEIESLKLRNQVLRDDNAAQAINLTKLPEILVENSTLQAMSVANILLEVVPGADGEGHEVYAKSVDDVVRTLGDLSDSLEVAQNALELLERDVMSALPGPQFMGQPDGGDVSLGEQVKHMGAEHQTLRDVLALLAPDLKTMAILYQQQGQFDRAQALMSICKSVGVV